jgi:hypothetical protein
MEYLMHLLFQAWLAEQRTFLRRLRNFERVSTFFYHSLGALKVFVCRSEQASIIRLAFPTEKLKIIVEMKHD